MHRLSMTVRLGHTDAAGVVFQAEFFRLLHEAYEDMLEQADYPLAKVIAAGRVGFPLVKAEAEFKSPLRLGDRLSVEVQTEAVGAHHFVLRYDVRKGRQVAASGRTAHVAIAIATGKACAVPAPLVRILRRHLVPGRAPIAGPR